MEFYVLLGFCWVLIGFIIFKEGLHAKERDKLIELVVARHFNEYTSSDIARKESKRPQPQQDNKIRL